MPRVSQDYPGLTDGVRFVEYSQLLSLAELPPGTYIFTDTITFDARRRELAVLVEKRMLERGNAFRILNSPFRGSQARARFEHLFPGQFLARAKFKSRQLGEIKNRYLVESVAVDLDSEVDDEAAHLADVLLDGGNPDHLGLTANLPIDSIEFIFADRRLSIGGTDPLPKQAIDSFGLDVFAVGRATQNGLAHFVAIGDSVFDILPSQGGDTSLARAITESIIGLDTVKSGAPIPLNVGWEAIAKAMRLKSPS